MDEPTVGLDPKQIIEIRDLIRSLKEKHTVILSSHILQEISAVCDHVFIISKGALVASDSMEHLESRMSGAQQLDVVVRGTKEQLEELHTLDGVQECRIVREVPEESAESSENDLTDAAETLDSDAEKTVICARRYSVIAWNMMWYCWNKKLIRRRWKMYSWS